MIYYIYIYNIITIYVCIYIILNIYTHIYIGTGSPVNVQVVQDEHPATLFMTGLVPALLTVRAVVEILAGQQLFCEYGPLYWGSNVVNAQGPVVFPLVYAHAHLTLPSHNPGQLVYMPLPLPPDDVIADADDVERSPRSSLVGDAAMDLLQIRGDAVPDASLDLAVTPVKC